MAKTADGFRVGHPSQLQQTDIVKIPGVGEVTYQQALEYGLISDLFGKQRAPSEAERAQQEQQRLERKR